MYNIYIIYTWKIIQLKIKTTGGDFNSNIDYNDNIKNKTINFLL